MDTHDLPNDIAVEQSLLGSLLIDRDAIALIADMMTYESFYQTNHQLIYRAMLALWKMRKPIDFTTLPSFLRSKGLLDTVGGVSYLSELMRSVPTAVHVVYYAEIALGLQQRREAIQCGQDMVRVGYDLKNENPEFDSLLADFRRRIMAYDPKPEESMSIGVLADDALHRARGRWDGSLKEDFVRTNFSTIDRMLGGGMRGGDLGVLMARTSVGKTAMMLSMARPQKAFVVSLEMTKEAIVDRMIAQVAKVRYDVSLGISDPVHRDLWIAAQGTVAELPIHILGRSTDKLDSITVDRIESALTELRMTQDIDAIYIDHLAHVRLGGPPPRNDYEKTNRITEGLKEMALRQSIPVVLLHQVNREVEKRAGYESRMSDGRDSGRVEELADWVIVLNRRRAYVDRGLADGSDVEDYWNVGYGLQKATANLEKNRNGVIGKVWLGYEPEWMRFIEVDQRLAS